MMMTMQRERNKLVFHLCMRVEAIIPIDQISMDFPVACLGYLELTREVSCSSGEARRFSW